MAPIHPAFVHFPISLLLLSVAADLIGGWTKSSAARVVGFWSLVTATLGANAAVIAGLYDMEKAEHVDLVHVHMRLGIALLVVLCVVLYWRHRLHRHGGGVGRAYLVVAPMLAALMLLQSWLGGHLVFAEGVGVARLTTEEPMSGAEHSHGGESKGHGAAVGEGEAQNASPDHHGAQMNGSGHEAMGHEDKNSATPMSHRGANGSEMKHESGDEMKHGEMKDGEMKDGEMKDGAMKDGAMNHGAMKDGAMKDGAMKDGAMKDGAMQDGAMQDGAMKNGAMNHEMAPGATNHGEMKPGDAKATEAKDGAAKPGGMGQGEMNHGEMHDGAEIDGEQRREPGADAPKPRLPSSVVGGRTPLPPRVPSFSISSLPWSTLPATSSSPRPSSHPANPSAPSPPPYGAPSSLSPAPLLPISPQGSDAGPETSPE